MVTNKGSQSGLDNSFVFGKHSKAPAPKGEKIIQK